MRSFWDTSIKNKLLAIAMVTSGAAVLAAYAAFITSDYISLRQAEVKKLSILAEVTSHNVRAAVAFNDVDAARADLEALEAETYVVAAAVYTPEGHLFAVYERPGAKDGVTAPPQKKDTHYYEENFLHFFRQIILDEEVIGELYVKFDMSGLAAAIRNRLGIGLLILAGCFFLAFLFSTKLQKVISGPILRLAEVARAVTQQKDYSVRARKGYNDELGALTDTFNEMLGQIELRDRELRKFSAELERRVEERTRELRETQGRMVQAEKMSAIGQLAGGIAHDFNNLLTVISGYAGLLVKGSRAGEPVRADAEEIQKAAERAARLTSQLLSFSRKQMIQARVVNVNELVLKAEPQLKGLLTPKTEYAFVPAKEIGLTKIDADQLEQALAHLVLNAAEAMPAGGKITIETANKELDERYTEQNEDVKTGPYVMLAVSDTGFGMTEEVKAHLFEPFYTTKKTGEVGKNTGLGLATTYGIVRQAGGHIFVYSEVNHGTTVKIYLPRILEDALKGPAAVDKPTTPRGAETILVVEDEKVVRNLTKRILAEQGYKVLEASAGDEALQLFREKPGLKIDLLLTDIVMPKMGGKELAERIRILQPSARILFFSGYTDEAIVRQGVLDRGIPFLQKPFSPQVLASKVREVLDQTASL
jgi:signal transduction histidine kinase/ActR/RegA family two-component response regulator